MRYLFLGLRIIYLYILLAAHMFHVEIEHSLTTCGSQTLVYLSVLWLSNYDFVSVISI